MIFSTSRSFLIVFLLILMSSCTLEQRHVKRTRHIEHVKSLYANYPDVVLSARDKEPDPEDPTISKRQWEKISHEWKQKLLEESGRIIFSQI